MEKDFDKWNNLKKEINSKKQKFYVKQREVWSVRMWKNVWFEEDWKWEDFERPVLVLKKIWIMYLCISMTTQWKDNDFYYKLLYTRKFLYNFITSKIIWFKKVSL